MASVVKYGTQTGPTAGTAVVATSALTAGRYTVAVVTGIEGTGTLADNDNMQLLNSAGTVSALMASYIGTARVSNPVITLDVASGGTLSVVAVVDAGTAAIYSALIVANPEALYP